MSKEIKNLIKAAWVVVDGWNCNDYNDIPDDVHALLIALENVNEKLSQEEVKDA